jgi:hypothetical protein
MKKIELSVIGLLLAAASGFAGCEYYAADQIREVKAAPVQKVEKPAEETKVEENVIVPQKSDDSWRIEKEALEKRIAELAKAVEDAKTPVQPVTPPPASPTPAPQTPPSASPVVIIPRQMKDVALAPKMTSIAPVTEPARKLALDGSDRTSFWTAEGGDGGERFRTMCGIGEVVVGYKLNSGDILDRLVSIVCKPLEKVARGTIGDFLEVAVDGGGKGGGEIRLVTAHEGEAMVGWNSKMGLFSEGPYVVTEFQPLSARILPEIGVINESREGDKFGLGSDGENNQANRDMTFNRCPDGYVLTGIEGLAGNYVDNLKGHCARVVVKNL